MQLSDEVEQIVVIYQWRVDQFFASAKVDLGAASQVRPQQLFCHSMTKFFFLPLSDSKGKRSSIFLTRAWLPISMTRICLQKRHLYRRSSSITRRDVNQKNKYYLFSLRCGRSQDDRFSYPFVCLNL